MCLLHFCLCQPVCGLLVRRPALLAVLFCWLFFSFFLRCLWFGSSAGRAAATACNGSREAPPGRGYVMRFHLSTSPPSLFLSLSLCASSHCISFLFLFLSLSLAHSAQIASVGKATVADQKPSACGMPHAVQPLPPPATSPLLPAH